MSNKFYRDFENYFRGSRELIKERLSIYIPYLALLKENLEHCGPALDIGCGRGEWLEILNSQSFVSHGVDIDEGMLEDCLSRGLSVEKSDALEYLKGLPDSSCSIITGFHIVEHIPFEYLRDVIDESHRVLMPGGVLILETPNPENLVVATRNFYIDPTHTKPIPPALLLYLVDY